MKLCIKPHKVCFSNGKTDGICWLATIWSSVISQLAARNSWLHPQLILPQTLDRQDLHEVSFEGFGFTIGRLLPHVLLSVLIVQEHVVSYMQHINFKSPDCHYPSKITHCNSWFGQKVLVHPWKFVNISKGTNILIRVASLKLLSPWLRESCKITQPRGSGRKPTILIFLI